MFELALLAVNLDAHAAADTSTYAIPTGSAAKAELILVPPDVRGLSQVSVVCRSDRLFGGLPTGLTDPFEQEVELTCTLRPDSTLAWMTFIFESSVVPDVAATTRLVGTGNSTTGAFVRLTPDGPVEWFPITLRIDDAGRGQTVVNRNVGGREPREPLSVATKARLQQIISLVRSLRRG